MLAAKKIREFQKFKENVDSDLRIHTWNGHELSSSNYEFHGGIKDSHLRQNYQQLLLRESEKNDENFWNFSLKTVF